MMEKHKTGAATLLIHILAIMATNMLTMRTVRGRVPALLRTKVANILAMWYFESAAAMVKPPRRSMMTGVHMDAKIYIVAFFASSRLYGFSSDLETRKVTARNGTKRAVTNSGRTCKKYQPSLKKKKKA